MFFLKTLALLLLSLVIVTDAKYGNFCKSNRDCTGHEYDIFGLEKCENGRCICKKQIDFQYTAYGESSCSVNGNNLGRGYNCKTRGSFSLTSIECPHGQMCKLSICICEEENLFMAKKMCLPRTFVKPMAKCNITNNVIYACDNFGNNTFCTNKQCHCLRDYYYNFTSSSCETKDSFKKFHKISEYKALPRGYCLDDSDCINGLRCASNKTCACPYGCTYNEKELLCDCGNIEFQTPAGIIAAGIVIGLCFSICWCCIIKKTIKNHKKKTEEMRMQQMNLGIRRSISSSSSSSSEHNANQSDDLAKAGFPVADNPPSYSEVSSYPAQPQPPNDNFASNTFPANPGYPIDSLDYPQPPPYPVTPPVANDPVPYPMNPLNQTTNSVPASYPSNDQPAFNPEYQTAPQQPLAPTGFTTASAPPDLNFETNPSLQPSNPYSQSQPKRY